LLVKLQVPTEHWPAIAGEMRELDGFQAPGSKAFHLSQLQAVMSMVFTMLIFRPYPKCGIYPRRVWPAGVVGACLRGKDIVPVCVVVSYSLILVLPQNPCSCNPLFERASSLKHFLIDQYTHVLFTRPTPLPFSSGIGLPGAHLHALG
jgi:hypothetical protein